jgi:hypothetical protein
MPDGCSQLIKFFAEFMTLSIRSSHHEQRQGQSEEREKETAENLNGKKSREKG